MIGIVSRAEWGARYSAGAGPAPLPAREVWLHHSVTTAPSPAGEVAAMRQLEQIGESRFGQGVSYTFAVMPTGRVYEGHGVGTLGAHTAKRNGIARAIVLVGNYDTTQPTPAQVESAARLLADGQRAGWWTAARLNGGHQQAPGASTACPGRYGMGAISSINSRAAAIAGGATPISEDDEMNADQEDWLHAARNDAANAAGIASEIRNWILDPNHGILKQLGALGAAVAANRDDVNEQQVAQLVITGLLPAVTAAVGNQSGLDEARVAELVENAVRGVFADAATA